MAAAMSSARHDDTSFSIKDLTTCSLCNKTELTSPLKTLPCFSSVCIDCLEKNVKRNVSSKFNCPCCTEDHRMPDGGVKDLEDNVFTINMKCLSDILSNDPPKCKACQMAGEVTPSSTYCLLCRNHFCQSDRPRHMATPGHEVISHSELHSEQVIPKILSSYSEMCENSEIHEDSQPFRHFCIQCQTLSCGECLTYKHEGHQKMPLKQAGEKQAKELNEKVVKIKEMKAQKKEYLKILQKNMLKVNQNKANTAQEFQSFGAEIKQMVDRVIKEKLDDLDIDANIVKEKINQAMADVGGDERRLEVATNHMETFLAYSSHVNVLNKCKSFKTKLDMCKENIKNTEGVKAKQFPFKHETLLEIHRSLTKAFLGKELQDTSTVAKIDEEYHDVAVDLDNHDIIAINKQKVHIFKMNGGKKGQINCQGLVDGSSLAVHDNLLYITDRKKMEVVAFDRNGTRKRCVKLSSNQGGDIHLDIDPIDSTIYVSCQSDGVVYRCSKTQTQLQPFITKGLNGPSHICVLPSTGLAISNQGSMEIHMYTYEGTLVWKYRNQGSERILRSMCVDHLGNIFVADPSAKQLQYLTPQGTLLRYVQMTGIPGSLAIRSDRLIVLNKKRSGLSALGKFFNFSGKSLPSLSIVKCEYK